MFLSTPHPTPKKREGMETKTSPQVLIIKIFVSLQALVSYPIIIIVANYSKHKDLLPPYHHHHHFVNIAT